MILRKIIYDLREAIRQYSDDSNITNEYLAYQIHISRALLLKQAFSNRAFIIPQKDRQQFNYTLELAQDNEFDDSLGTILRTVDPIEKPLEPFNFKSNIKINSGSYKDPSFILVSQERFPYVGRNKWNPNQIYVTIGNDFRLYFTSTNPKVKLLDNIRVSMVTENPEEAYEASVDYISGVDFWDVEYPLEDNMIFQMNDMILKKLVNILQMPEDKSNNSDDA